MAIKQRSIVTCIILSLVNSGILEIVRMLFLSFLGFFLAEKKLAEGRAAKGIPHTDNSILYLILGLGIVSACMMQNDLNKPAPAEV